MTPHRCIPFILVLTLPVVAMASTPGVSINMPPTSAEISVLKQALGADYGDLQPFMAGHVDLNGDGRADLLARSDGMGGCGSAGCQTFAVMAAPSGYAGHAIRLAAAAGRVFVLPTVHHSMHDLRFESGTYTFKWDGKAYQ